MGKIVLIFLMVAAMVVHGCSDNQDGFAPIGDTGGDVNTEEYLQDAAGYDVILSDYLGEDGRVDYVGLKNDRTKLDDYIEAIEGVRFNNYFEANDEFTDSERLAFWINVYNALTLQLIIDNYPVDSILSLGRGLPWDVFKFSVGGQTITLNNIEHDIIRKIFSEPRIHFAVNCASVSCPKLRGSAYTGENLDAELEEQAELFANDDTLHVIIVPQKNSVQLNILMKLYQVDFGPDFGNGTIEDVVDFLAPLVHDKGKSEFLADFPATSVKFIPYNWNLNEQK